MIYDRLSIGTASMEETLSVWQGLLGFVSMPEHTPSPQALADFWQLSERAITRCALLGTPGAPGGRLQVVEFAGQAEAVRDNAATTDLCPKNLDVNVIDLPARVQGLVAGGLSLRSEPVAYRVDDLDVREVQIPLNEGVNLVLAEIIGEPLATTTTGFGGITSVVTTTADLAAEIDFFETLGFALLDYHRLAGPAIEQMIGLDPGGSLSMQLLGEPAHRFGRAELIKYDGARGEDRYHRAQPPALGLFRGTVLTEDLEGLRQRCDAKRFTLGAIRSLATPAQTYRGCTVVAPSGWQIEVLEPLPD